MRTQMVRERGGCLTAWLTLAIIGNPLVGIYYLVSGSELGQVLNLPDWVIPFLAFLAFANTIFVLGMWSWRKWGAYGFVASTIAVFFVNLMTLGLSLSTFAGLFAIVLLAYLLRDKWQEFE